MPLFRFREVFRVRVLRNPLACVVGTITIPFGKWSTYHVPHIFFFFSLRTRGWISTSASSVLGTIMHVVVVSPYFIVVVG